MSSQAGRKRRYVSLELRFIALQNSDPWTRRNYLIDSASCYSKPAPHPLNGARRAREPAQRGKLNMSGLGRRVADREDSGRKWFATTPYRGCSSGWWSSWWYWYAA